MSRRPSASARRDWLRQIVEGTVNLGAMAVLVVLFDRTGHGLHASWCGRRHIGEAVAKMAGRDRPYSERQVGRWLAELTAAGWLDTKHRWHQDADRSRCTALRSLSAKLLGALDRLAGKRWRKRAKADTAPQPRPVEVVPVWDLDEHGNAIRVERGPPAS